MILCRLLKHCLHLSFCMRTLQVVWDTVKDHNVLLDVINYVKFINILILISI